MRNKHLLFKEGNQALITRNILFDDLIKTFLLTSKTLVGMRPATAFIRYQLREIPLTEQPF